MSKPRLERLFPEASALTPEQQFELYERARYQTFVQDRQTVPFFFIAACGLILLIASSVMFTVFFGLPVWLEAAIIAAVTIVVLFAYQRFYLALIKPRLRNLVHAQLQSHYTNISIRKR